MRCSSSGRFSGLVKKSAACIATVRRVTWLDNALMKMTGMSFVAGWRFKISHTDNPSRSGSRISSRIKSGLHSRAWLKAWTPSLATMKS